MATLHWRQVAEGHCGFCGQRHALDIEYRCVGCDRGVCALCVVTIREVDRRVAWCPQCGPEAGRRGDSTEVR